MRGATLVFGAVAAIASAGVAQTYIVNRLPNRPPPGMGEVKIEKAAVAGQEIRVWAASLLNPDCTAAGTMTTTILEQPRHGSVRLSDDPSYPNFPLTNVRYACNSRKSPGEQAFYTAPADYHGHDKFVFQNTTSEGRIRRIVVDVTVQ